jgi:hypothetical protein
MKKTALVSLVTLLLSIFAMSVQAEAICKASMMGRVCFDSNGKELTVAEMQAATAEAERKEAAEKVAKK